MAEILPQQNKLVAVYGRVSTANQEKEGTIESQLSKVREVAKEKGFKIIREYTDEGWSGSILARPALDQLREDAKKKLWEVVLVYDPDRIARNGSYQELVREELEEAGIELLFVTVPPARNDEDRVMNKMRGIFAEYEKMKITERFRLGKLRKAKNGHVIVSEAPYGYTFIKRKGKPGDVDFVQGHYEINKREQKIVENIFSWVGDEGLTLRGVVKRLQDSGIPPRRSKRGVWSTSTLSTLLKNKTYIGKGHYGASYAVVPENPLKNEQYKKIKKTSRRGRPEDEWIIINTPKIIDEVLFTKAQERMALNFQSSIRNTKNEYLLSHRIWCPCGCRRAGEGPQKGKHLYYRCTSRVKSFPLTSTCNEKALNARIVDKLVWQKMSNLLRSPDLLLKQAKRWVENRNNSSQPTTIDIKETKIEISRIKEQEGRFVKAFGAGLISIEELAEYTMPLKEKTASLENQINKASESNVRHSDVNLPRADEIQAFADLCDKKFNSLKFNEKQSIVRDIITKVVGTRSELQVCGYIPIKSNINVFTSNRHRGSSKRRQIDAF